jgi:hypothetical protein
MVGSRCGREPAQNYPAIIFVDQNGLSERPHRVRTWAPRWQTPVLQYDFNW